MTRITFTADEQHVNIINEVHDEENIDSQAAAVRACIGRYAELQQRAESLQHERDDLAATVEQLRETVATQADRIERLERERTDLQETVTEHESTIEELEADVDRLQNEKQQILAQREEHTELVRAVDRQRTLEEKRAEAGVLTRLKWWAVGMNDEQD